MMMMLLVTVSKSEVWSLEYYIGGVRSNSL
jgi:hypothetical protein